MTLRNRFSFTFTAGEILAAVNAKVEHHQEKMNWWDHERTAFDELDDNQAHQAHSQKCRDKIQSHQHRMWNYERWVRALSTVKPDQPFTLDVDDVAYFGL